MYYNTNNCSIRSVVHSRVFTRRSLSTTWGVTMSHLMPNISSLSCQIIQNTSLSGGLQLLMAPCTDVPATPGSNLQAMWSLMNPDPQIKI